MLMNDRFVEIDGKRLRYRTLGSGQRDLLVLHTLRTQLEHAQRITPRLEEHFRIHLIDLPGHGESTLDPSADYSALALTDVVRRFIEQMDLGGCALLGESIGASMSLLIAATRPELVSLVVASNPYDYDEPMIGGPKGPVVTWLGKRKLLARIAVGNRPAILRPALEGGFADGKRLPQDYVELLARTAREKPDFGQAQRQLLRASKSWSDAADAHYGSIPAALPVVLAYGDHDWAEPEHRQANADRIPGIDRPLILEDTGHFAYMESPDRIVDIVLRASESASPPNGRS